MPIVLLQRSRPLNYKTSQTPALCMRVWTLHSKANTWGSSSPDPSMASSASLITAAGPDFLGRGTAALRGLAFRASRASRACPSPAFLGQACASTSTASSYSQVLMRLWQVPVAREAEDREAWQWEWGAIAFSSLPQQAKLLKDVWHLHADLSVKMICLLRSARPSCVQAYRRSLY